MDGEEHGKGGGVTRLGLGFGGFGSDVYAQERRVWENPDLDCYCCFPGCWAVRAVGD